MTERELVYKEDVLRIIESPFEHDREGLLCGGWEPQEVVDDYAENILREVKKLKSTTPNNQWISVEDRLPEPTYQVLVYTSDCWIVIDALDNNGEFMECGYNVTHWMPLPEAPKWGDIDV